MTYIPSVDRYNDMIYRRCGRSGIRLPAISLGLWHNFGGADTGKNAKAMIFRAFDLGITHFDLANNYGPPPGSAEDTFGRIMSHDLMAYRDEMIISSKAGYLMWPGPYGEWGSRKYLLASLDQSLKRMGLEYVDIFYSHRYDPDTPLEETMGALAHAVRQGKALYVGISNYPGEQTRKACAILRELGVPCLIHQQRYNMFGRDPESHLFPALHDEKIGMIAFCPLAQGLLSSRYLTGVPGDSRAAGPAVFLQPDHVRQNIDKIVDLNNIAQERGQSLAQMALAWTLRESIVTSALIGASRPEQIEENVGALNNLTFTRPELAAIDAILTRPVPTA